MSEVKIREVASNESEETLYQFYIDYFMPLKNLINEIYEASGCAKVRAEKLEVLWGTNYWRELLNQPLDCEESKAKMEALGFEYSRGIGVDYYHPELKARILISPQDEFENAGPNPEGAILDVLSITIPSVHFRQERRYGRRRPNAEMGTNDSYVELRINNKGLREMIEDGDHDLIKTALDELAEAITNILNLRVDERANVSRKLACYDDGINTFQKSELLNFKEQAI